MRKNIRLSREIFGADAIPYGVAMTNFAALQSRLGNHREAIRITLEAEPIYRKGYGEDHPRYAYLRENLADSQEQVGDLEGSEENYLKAIAILSRAFRCRPSRGRDHAIALWVAAE
ncbi:MAG: tetratricopeptide repeat protein [Woeseiaceae bacterium]|nr:tetratricopeptide repeat protein [Woeseiaceae bacterium]